jgi:hypothetical protein
MILRRVTEHVKAQSWIAVAIPPRLARAVAAALATRGGGLRKSLAT